jgi:hypothetical protein
MSVLSFPRLYLKGEMSWDPIVSNNGSDYDGVRAEARFLSADETVQQFRDRLIDDVGDWNYFGTHHCALYKAKVGGGAVQPHSAVVDDDALVGAPVGLVGKLVDIDPTGAFSQIFFDELTLGLPGRAHVRARPLRRMSSRWLHFTRNSSSELIIAGRASAAWQTVFPKETVEITRADGSPLLRALAAALEGPQALGLMIRLSTYRTRYFLNGELNHFEPAHTQAELQALHRAGLPVSNPAYSLVVGTIGIWSVGDSESVPAGRFLAPRLIDANGRSAIGPAVAEVDETAGVLSMDLANTLPENTPGADKRDLGTLTVRVQSAGGTTDVADLPFSRYDRPAYLKQAGIIDIDLRDTPAAAEALRAGGALSVHAPGPSGPVELLREDLLTAWSEDCNVYLEEPGGGVDGTTLSIQVRERGLPPTGEVAVLVATYVAGPTGLTLVSDATRLVPVSATGQAELTVPAGAPGFRHLRFLPFATMNPQPVPEGVVRPASALLTRLQLTTVRTLPFDDALGAVPDAALTWQFVYRTVLRTYDAISPRMSNIIDLGDENAVRTFARRFLEVVDDDLFESGRYMPVTRDLSRGKRTLLRRFCERLLEGASVGGDEPEPRADAAPFTAEPIARAVLFDRRGPT